MKKRVFLTVLDSVGVGAMPDAASYGDEGSNTLLAASKSKYFKLPNLEKLGLFQIGGIGFNDPKIQAMGAYGKLAERSKGKDTTTGHWEIAGIVSEQPMPVFPNGFPKEVIDAFENETGRKTLCNKPYSGTDVIRDYGREHMATGALIVYTSADSVFQIAAHEDIVPVEQLYDYCRIARRILTGKYSVGRVIARPFAGIYPDFERTVRRHDFSLKPPAETMMTQLSDSGYDVISIGKIVDIFAEEGITQAFRTTGNLNGIETLKETMKKDFCGLCFTNLVDFDMKYGHRNDVDGYAKALSEFDTHLPQISELLQDGDILMITADHGCDPSTDSTDHSREYIPILAYGRCIRQDTDLGIRTGFGDIGATVLDYFDVTSHIQGTSFWPEIHVV